MGEWLQDEPCPEKQKSATEWRGGANYFFWSALQEHTKIQMIKGKATVPILKLHSKSTHLQSDRSSSLHRTLPGGETDLCCILCAIKTFYHTHVQRETETEREEQIPVTKQLETKFKGGSMKRKGLLLSLQSTILLLSWDKGTCTWSAVGFLAYVMWSATR